MYIADQWSDFEVLDAGNGEKLERWGDVILRRPDPQAIWPRVGNDKLWNRAHGIYHRASTGGGSWEFTKPLPESWNINYRSLSFRVHPMGFKHTGLFPEQAVNWDWMAGEVKKAGRAVSALNLFAYTGGATAALAAAGASVCHVDAAKQMVERAKENLALSALESAPVRTIVDDCLKFVQREARRGRKYDAIVMDPPSFGRGPGGEVWKLEDALFGLLEACMQVLSDTPVFVLVNSYTTGLQPAVIRNMLTLAIERRFGGYTEADEVVLPVSAGGIVLPCGASGRWIA